ncbi:hypothetical protein EVAR_32787_1 [Eumeta japonica]|uniref:Uncharacterized protein n=1 Tax=Eumeta variegata TaxID=151549 RepID=A0A4C1WF61_EUMVA|nr:hypothetical protein EVAR_32787_1 [Eumeta japonica]
MRKHKFRAHYPNGEEGRSIGPTSKDFLEAPLDRGQGINFIAQEDNPNGRLFDSILYRKKRGADAVEGNFPFVRAKELFVNSSTLVVLRAYIFQGLMGELRSRRRHGSRAHLLLGTECLTRMIGINIFTSYEVAMSVYSREFLTNVSVKEDNSAPPAPRAPRPAARRALILHCTAIPNFCELDTAAPVIRLAATLRTNEILSGRREKVKDNEYISPLQIYSGIKASRIIRIQKVLAEFACEPKLPARKELYGNSVSLNQLYLSVVVRLMNSFSIEGAVLVGGWLMTIVADALADGPV